MPVRELEEKPQEKRVWKRIDEQERLKLQKTVALGLPVDLAGKIINISSRNANRIMTRFPQAKSHEM